MRRAFAALGLALATFLFTAAGARSDDTAATAARFASLKDDAPRLRAFLYRMPKGGDLHIHLSGAIYAERYVEWASGDGLCLQADYRIVAPPCTPEAPPVAEAVRSQAVRDRLINALSVRSFVPTAAVPSTHDQFFGTFGKFSAVTQPRPAALVADVARRKAAENIQYLELMLTFSTAADVARLSATLDTSRGFDDLLSTLRAEGLLDVAAKQRDQAAALADQVNALLGCGTPAAEPACGVTIRYIAQVSRNTPPAAVFTQTALAAALVRAAPAVVGLNLVQPEDYPIARRDYRLHMRMIGFLAGGDVPVALHAGEVWLGLVPPEDLRSHIRDAVEIAGARRVGHAASLAFEHDLEGLLALMHARGTTVETNLTSNDLILGVRGPEHPLRTYLRAHIPVTLSTDDEGVSRTDLTTEYYRAAREHGLDYRTLKQIARNALIRSFLPDAERRAELARLDGAFATFERTEARRPQQ